MTTPYSQDLRVRLLGAYARGMKTKQISVIFAVSPSWARRVKQRRRETGETTHRPMGGPGVIKVNRARLTELVHEHPDATLAELRELLEVDCALSTISEALKALGLSFKNKRSTRRNRIVQTLSNDGPNGVHGHKMSMPLV
ncbi:MAG: transposase [Planctomycetes bacterium]|nr:transposase [Planctomycetota bacterium]